MPNSKSRKNNLKTQKKNNKKKNCKKKNHSVNNVYSSESFQEMYPMTDSEVLRRWVKELSDKKHSQKEISSTDIRLASQMLQIDCFKNFESIKNKEDQLKSIAQHVIKKSSTYEQHVPENISNNLVESGKWIVKIIMQSLRPQLRRHRNMEQVGGGSQEYISKRRTLCIKRIAQLRRRARRNKINPKKYE